MLYIKDIFSCGVSNVRLSRYCSLSKALTVTVGRMFGNVKRENHFNEVLINAGTTGACWGEHSSALPGSVLFQEQALPWSIHLCSALLWLQWCKCVEYLQERDYKSVGVTWTGVGCVRRLVKKERLCWGRSLRWGIRLRRHLQICSLHSRTITPQWDEFLHWT